MKAQGCQRFHKNPLPPSFPAAGNEAYRRIMSGWRQRQCKVCRRWLVWERP